MIILSVNLNNYLILNINTNNKILEKKITIYQYASLIGNNLIHTIIRKYVFRLYENIVTYINIYTY